MPHSTADDIAAVFIVNLTQHTVPRNPLLIVEIEGPHDPKSHCDIIHFVSSADRYNIPQSCNLPGARLHVDWTGNPVEFTRIMRPLVSAMSDGGLMSCDHSISAVLPLPWRTDISHKTRHDL